jgi:hypothetical protein
MLGRATYGRKNETVVLFSIVPGEDESRVHAQRERDNCQSLKGSYDGDSLHSTSSNHDGGCFPERKFQ